MHMPEGDPHPSTLSGFRGTRDPECSVTRSRSGRENERVEFEDVQPQSIPNPTEENFPRMCITQLLDRVSHIYYTGNELTNRDSMRVHGTFTAVTKVWKEIFIIPPVRDGVVSYDDTWSILSNVRQLLPNIDFSHIKSRNVNILHLMTYLTVAADREDDITIARAFILFIMGHLWFQTANDTVPLGYLTAVADLDSVAQYDWGSAILSFLYNGLDTVVTTGGAITGFVQLLMYWFYEYCGVGHPIVKEDVKYSAYLRLRAWKRRNMKKTNDQATNLFILGRYHIDHHIINTITWESWLESAVAGEVRIPLDPLLNMSPHISPAALHEIRQAGFLDYSQRMGNIDLFGPTALRAGITPVVVTSATVHSLSQDFSLPDEVEGPDPGWHMEWTGQRERLPIARLRDPLPMSSSYDVDEL
ncbi:hypothetical protein GIB67_025837 [Kingdonia uniflora]|uniref:Aminotransferase-like plant mobile domain-containing protein n=1 Tax=Kingdonia uniflora TaxID=39325 RepID=A0A7J7N4D7_9MAGN|nr:hypothetical protein GIB67_025837 [Kingdonia uniflora]